MSKHCRFGDSRCHFVRKWVVTHKVYARHLEWAAVASFISVLRAQISQTGKRRQLMLLGMQKCSTFGVKLCKTDPIMVRVVVYSVHETLVSCVRCQFLERLFGRAQVLRFEMCYTFGCVSVLVGSVCRVLHNV